MNSATVTAIEELRDLKVVALKRKYRELFGEDSRSSNKQYLSRRVAWRLQARVEGDLSERARRGPLRSPMMRTFAHVRPRASRPRMLPRIHLG